MDKWIDLGGENGWRGGSWECWVLGRLAKQTGGEPLQASSSHTRLDSGISQPPH